MKRNILAVLALMAVGARADTPVVQPVLDVPLRDPPICRGPAGTYYLTGTSGPDFLNNDGIYLWKSTDLKHWSPLCKVWNLQRGPDQGNARRLGVDLWRLASGRVTPAQLGLTVLAPVAT